MLRIRLSRTGKKKQPSFRVVVADIEAPRDGRIVESIGHYNPMPNPIVYAIKEGRALHWLSVGAQPTDAVRRLLEKQGTFERLERLHAGESLEDLVAEYHGEGEEAEAAADEAEAEAEEEMEADAEPAVAAVAEEE
jgi:small subunit ribosomal protein S16